MAEWRKKKGKKTNWGDWYRSDEEFEAWKNGDDEDDDFDGEPGWD